MERGDPRTTFVQCDFGAPSNIIDGYTASYFNTICMLSVDTMTLLYIYIYLYDIYHSKSPEVLKSQTPHSSNPLGHSQQPCQAPPSSAREGAPLGRSRTAAADEASLGSHGEAAVVGCC